MGCTVNPEEAKLNEISPKPRHEPLTPFIWLLRILKLTNRRENGGCGEQKEGMVLFWWGIAFSQGYWFQFYKFKK